MVRVLRFPLKVPVPVWGVTSPLERPGMKKLAVETIIIPMEEGVAREPSVDPEDRITEAIEIMLKKDVKRIAVTRGNKLMGMIRLQDAFKQIGLEGGPTSKKKRSLVVQGHKITVNNEGE